MSDYNNIKCEHIDELLTAHISNGEYDGDGCWFINDAFCWQCDKSYDIVLALDSVEGS